MLKTKYMFSYKVIEQTGNTMGHIYRRYKDDVCDECRTESPEGCEEGHCMICVGKKTLGNGKCYCDQCLECYGWAGGNECNSCD